MPENDYLAEVGKDNINRYIESLINEAEAWFNLLVDQVGFVNAHRMKREQPPDTQMPEGCCREKEEN